MFVLLIPGSDSWIVRCVHLKMELESNFGLALNRIQEVLSEDCYSYLVSVLTEAEEELTLSGEGDGRGPRPRNPNLLSSLGVGKRPVPGPHINLSSLNRTRGTSVPNDILCSRLPVCKRILNRTLPEELGRGPINSSFQNQIQLVERKKSEFVPIIGKIVYPETGTFISPAKNPKPKIGKGVCELHESISNPLYKNYRHEGYVKSEDELGRDLISQFTQAFNTWLDSLEGDKVQVEPELLVKIMRTDLEVPEPELLQDVDRVLYAFPKLKL